MTAWDSCVLSSKLDGEYLRLSSVMQIAGATRWKVLERYISNAGERERERISEVHSLQFLWRIRQSVVIFSCKLRSGWHARSYRRAEQYILQTRIILSAHAQLSQSTRKREKKEHTQRTIDASRYVYSQSQLNKLSQTWNPRAVFQRDEILYLGARKREKRKSTVTARNRFVVGKISFVN